VSGASGGPYTLAGVTADKLASSLRIEGLSTAPTYSLVVRTVTDPHSQNQNTVMSEFSAEISVSMPVAAMDLTLSAGGAATAATIPATLATETRYGTLELGSDQPLSVAALRLTTNQRGEMLMTSTPVADLTRPLSTKPIYFAEFIDGGGYTTTLMLLNTSSVMMSGVLRIYDNDGAPLAVQQVGGASGSAFAYAIVPGGAYVLQTDAAPVNFKVGWVELIPNPGTFTPMGAGLYQSSQNGVLAAESGIAAARFSGAIAGRGDRANI
jgi:hypothetical protein